MPKVKQKISGGFRMQSGLATFCTIMVLPCLLNTLSVIRNVKSEHRRKTVTRVEGQWRIVSDDSTNLAFKVIETGKHSHASAWLLFASSHGTHATVR
jgi:hypothetical protein